MCVFRIGRITKDVTATQCFIIFHCEYVCLCVVLRLLDALLICNITV